MGWIHPGLTLTKNVILPFYSLHDFILCLLPPSPSLQFLAQLKLMDYSLLVGIHDVERAEQEEVESEDNEGDDEGESDGGIGTPPDSPSNTLDSTKPLSPGEFDPTIDVYAIKSNDGEWRGEEEGFRRW